MKKIFSMIAAFSIGYSAVLFKPQNPPCDEHFSPCSASISKYYKQEAFSMQKYGALLSPFQTTVPTEYLKKCNDSDAFWAPSVIVDLYQILNFDSFPAEYNFERIVFYDKLDQINNILYNALVEHQNNWHALFDDFINKAHEIFAKNEKNKMIRKILIGKEVLKNALNIELKENEEGKMVLWRFTTSFDQDINKNAYISFGLSLLGGYILDGYIYDYECGFSNLSASTYAYCSNSLEAKTFNENTSSHVLYYVTINQNYLTNNCVFYGKVNHENSCNHSILGTCPAIAQVAWGRGEYFHPKLNPITFEKDMLHTLDLHAQQ